jgi:hypothetical protein
MGRAVTVISDVGRPCLHPYAPTQMAMRASLDSETALFPQSGIAHLDNWSLAQPWNEATVAQAGRRPQLGGGSALVPVGGTVGGQPSACAELCLLVQLLKRSRVGGTGGPQGSQDCWHAYAMPHLVSRPFQV